MNKEVKPKEGKVKAVIGPGTGLGMGLLFKSEFSSVYEVSPTEGGHTDYSPRSDEDYDFLKFAKKYVEESQNVENLRAKG